MFAPERDAGWRGPRAPAPLDRFTHHCQPVSVSQSENPSAPCRGGDQKQALMDPLESSRNLQALVERLLKDREAERQDIGRELEDEIGSTLTVAEMNVQEALRSPSPQELSERLHAALKVVERAAKQVRDLAFTLRASFVDGLGLEPALCWFVNRQSSRAGLKVEFVSEPLERRLDWAIEMACFRVTQMALTNVTHHAKASAVSVGLAQKSAQLHLSVRDDGIGFEVAGARRKVVEMRRPGLLCMEDQAMGLGGGLEVNSAPGHGTEVHAWFPLRWRPTATATPA